MRDYTDTSEVKGDTLTVDLFYCRSNPCQHIEVGLMDLRAADSIRIRYDFERDGYVIEQAAIFEWNSMAEANAPNAADWQEVAFIDSWARQRIPHPDEPR